MVYVGGFYIHIGIVTVLTMFIFLNDDDPKNTAGIYFIKYSGHSYTSMEFKNVFLSLVSEQTVKILCTVVLLFRPLQLIGHMCRTFENSLHVNSLHLFVSVYKLSKLVFPSEKRLAFKIYITYIWCIYTFKCKSPEFSPFSWSNIFMTMNFFFSTISSLLVISESLSSSSSFVTHTVICTHKNNLSISSNFIVLDL